MSISVKARPFRVEDGSKFSSILCQVDVAARTSWPILITGETGVGKEVMARRIHDRSHRSGSPFIPVNCGAIGAHLFESELFGHERGAFTGAIKASKGLVRSAHQGTLFLDEIGELSMNLQVKLLRFLDSGEIRSVGSHRIDRPDARIVAATNRDLQSAVQNGEFRQDLLERLGVFSFAIPPLRDRTEEIADIGRSILEALDVSYDESIFKLLRSFHWPGNIRQLKNVLIRAASFGGARLTAEFLAQILDEEARHSGEPHHQVPNYLLSLDDIERRVIEDRLRLCRGNRQQAAKELGIAKSTLHEKLRRWKTIQP